jgi:hypothetical protein
MKRAIARTVSILGCVVVLSAGAGNAWAGSGGCNVPSCRPHFDAVSAPQPTADTGGLVFILLEMCASLLRF